jgi:glycine hydroxymethyltransferase
VAVRVDEKVFSLIRSERRRQQQELMLIPSENYASEAVRRALGSELTNKYSEGYPGKRYYQGNHLVDEIEEIAIERAKELFEVPHVNVQPYSGSPANLAVLAGLCRVRGPILSQDLSMGGHLSMGQKASVTSRYYRAYYYGLTDKGEINWKELEERAKSYRPEVIFCGGTAFTRTFNFSRYSKIAEEVGAYFVADISHIGGLVAGGAHPSPVRFAHVVVTTTHKTLRGPRGAIIMVTKKGLKKDPELPQKIDRAVFPGLQGGPHNNTLAAMAVALGEAQKAAFGKYAHRVVKNAQVLAKALLSYDFSLIGEKTNNHMIWIDLSNKRVDGWTAAWACEAAGLILNRQTIPFDKRSAYYPSGIRLGTPAITSQGMKEGQMRLVAQWLNEAIEAARGMDLGGIGSSEREQDQAARGRFKKEVLELPELRAIRKEVRSLCRSFPIP